VLINRRNLLLIELQVEARSEPLKVPHIHKYRCKDRYDYRVQTDLGF